MRKRHSPMSRRRFYSLAGTVAWSVAWLLVATTVAAEPPERILFGSCLVQYRAHPALAVAIERQPDAFVFLGDNVYADSDDPSGIQAAYNVLGASSLFQQLRATTPVYATWDDHDYGRNDAGREFPSREASEEIFERFWSVPDEVTGRPGIYQVVELASADRRVQLVLLDTRYFRTPLTRARPRPEGKGPYGRDPGDGTILGAAQWEWLESVLAEPVDLRIVTSSIQVLAEHHGWESWANFPHERDRLLSLLGETQSPTVIISGDRHFAEISRRSVSTDSGMQTYLDITSSGINRGYPVETPTSNDRRVDGYYVDPNVGELLLTWPSRPGPPVVRARIYNAEGEVEIEHVVDWGQ